MNNKYFKEIVKFINFLETLKENEKNKLEKGELIIEHILTPKNLAHNPNKYDEIENFNEIEVINRLGMMYSNEDGVRYLESLNLKKTQYERILKKLDSPFDKRDNIARLISKIIEATISFRLRSQAIQGTTSSD